MACRAVEKWTLPSLIGAYLDLTLALLFLAGATIAFFASKLLSLFGLSLPCSCDGRFGHPACTQTSLLLDFPVSRVAGVHRSLFSHFPYDSYLSTGSPSSPCCRYAVPSEDVGSSAAASLSRQSRSLSLPTPSASLRSRARPRVGDSMLNLEKLPSPSSRRLSVELRKSFEDEHGACLAEVAVTEEERDSCSGAGRFLEGERLDVLSLEKELGNGQGSIAALYLELEKERSAAATAAAEAMSMILRLQKEKAEIEMTARQYQRMIDEKSAYDQEEMEILKEIIVRQEREKRVLEKEVEMYKQVLESGFDNEQEDLFDEKKGSLSVFSENPVTMLQQIYSSIGKNEVPCGFGVETSPAVNSLQNFAGAVKHAELFNNGDDCVPESHEESTFKLSPTNMLKFYCADDPAFCNLNAPCDFTARNEGDEGDEGDEGTPIEMKVPVDDLRQMEGDAPDQQACKSSQPETESRIIKDGEVFHFEESSRQNAIPGPDFSKTEPCFRRSCSEMADKVDSTCGSTGRAPYLDLRRSSLPSVKSERHKIKTEVENLRKRLEVIRQGREKLNEVQSLSEPNKSFRPASLPPHLSSKAF